MIVSIVYVLVTVFLQGNNLTLLNTYSSFILRVVGHSAQTQQLELYLQNLEHYNSSATKTTGALSNCSATKTTRATNQQKVSTIYIYI